MVPVFSVIIIIMISRGHAFIIIISIIMMYTPHIELERCDQKRKTSIIWKQEHVKFKERFKKLLV